MGKVPELPCVREPWSLNPNKDPLWQFLFRKFVSCPHQALYHNHQWLALLSPPSWPHIRLRRGHATKNNCLTTWLQHKHLIYAIIILTPILAHMFNKNLVDGLLPNTRTTHTVAPIHKSSHVNFIGWCLTRNSSWFFIRESQVVKLRVALSSFQTFWKGVHKESLLHSFDDYTYICLSLSGTSKTQASTKSLDRV